MSKQLGILPGIPNHGRYMELRALSGADIPTLLQGLAPDLGLVIGLGAGLVRRFSMLEGLHGFQAVSGKGVEVPSTQADLWIWVRGRDRGDISKRARKILSQLRAGFEVVRSVDGFKYGIDLEVGLDLSGYEDGTENPEGEAAIDAAFAPDGSSFVSVQQWVHDLSHFDALALDARNNIFGRRISDNEEMEDAPEFASYCQIWCLRLMGHAANWPVLVVSIPSLNMTPVMTLAR